MGFQQCDRQCDHRDQEHVRYEFWSSIGILYFGG